ncbi:MAG: hypothetical protein AAF642_08815 [Pseudomonadota bacterium]
MSAAWIKALRFAALPGAVKVTFACQRVIEDGTPTTRYGLASVSGTGDVIGDDRDYDLLKAAMSPLETLADAYDHTDLNLELDLGSGQLSGLPIHRKL